MNKLVLIGIISSVLLIFYWSVYGQLFIMGNAPAFVGVIIVSGLGLFVAATTVEGKQTLKVVLDSRTEIRRVVWPTRIETIQTTLIVLVAITIAALVLWGLDSLFGWATAQILG